MKRFYYTQIRTRIVALLAFIIGVFWPWLWFTAWLLAWPYSWMTTLFGGHTDDLRAFFHKGSWSEWINALGKCFCAVFTGARI